MAQQLGYGALIKQARKGKGWTQRELAGRMGTSESTISNLEREQHPPTVPDEVNDLATALSLSPEMLLQKMGVRLTPPPTARYPRRLAEHLQKMTVGQMETLARMLDDFGYPTERGSQ